MTNQNHGPADRLQGENMDIPTKNESGSNQQETLKPQNERYSTFCNLQKCIMKVKGRLGNYFRMRETKEAPQSKDNIILDWSVYSKKHFAKLE